MNFCMGNCITMEDTNGNRKLLKMRREQKIDNVSALMDAYIAHMTNDLDTDVDFASDLGVIQMLVGAGSGS